MTTVSGGVKGLVARAQREAQRRAQSPSTAYLLLVMLQTGGPMGKLLSGLGVKESDLLSAIRVVDSESTSALERAVERAYRLAKATDAPQVLPAHLLLAIARDTRSAAHRSLEVIGTGSRRVQEAVHEVLQPEDAQEPPSSTYVRPTGSLSAQPPVKPSRPFARRTAEPAPLIELRVEQPVPDEEILIESSFAAPIETPTGAAEEELIVPSSSPFSLDAGKYPTLSKLGRNLTEMASLGRIDEVIGRDDEIERLLDVLARRRSNNPILVGPPGVGKDRHRRGARAAPCAKGGKGVRGLEGTILVELSAGGLGLGHRRPRRAVRADATAPVRGEARRTAKSSCSSTRFTRSSPAGTRPTTSRTSSRHRSLAASFPASGPPRTSSTASTSNGTQLSRAGSPPFT